MSHVNEGALHAYLDGALDEYPAGEAQRIRDHLDGCAQCSERLEDERALRSGAHAMLGLASPMVDMPSFEELRAYVERTRPARSTMVVRVTRLSWAASVLLALGVGWMLRGGRMETGSGMVMSAPDASGAMPEAVAEATRTSTAIDTPSEAAFADASSTDADLVSASEGAGMIAEEDFGARQDLPATSVAKVASVDGVDAAVPEMVAAEPEVQEALVVAPDAELRAMPEGAQAPQMVLRSDVVATAARSNQALGDQRDETRDALSGAAGASAAGGVGGAMDAEPLADDVTADSLGLAEEEARPERRRAESPTAFTAQMDRSGRGGVRVVPDDDHFSDEPFQAVPGFEVLALENLGDGLEFIGTVATQRLEGAAVMRVYVLEPDVGLEVLPVLESDFNEVRVSAEAGWVVLRGPRSEDELETLLMRLFPG